MTQIYTTIPKEQLEQFGSKEALIIALYTNKGKYVSAKKLAEIANYRVSGTQVELRKDITELLDAGLPIVANSSGFCYAEDMNQVNNYLECLNNRLAGLNRRIMAVEKIIERGYGG